MMTARELALLVKEARDAQRAYFDMKTRSPEALGRAKAAERRLDAALREILDPPGLFGSDDES